ncbi:MinD/ParA family ATP-binding protein [Microbacterium sp. YY-01]|uniref:MinD/ParA family ATP-binding protein n=1 Tax=Microbacterium sp. YY-01 TaxID=3421634 RepID=UPI003D165342
MAKEIPIMSKTAPEVSVIAREDGTATVTIDGAELELKADSLNAVTRTAVAHIAAAVAQPLSTAVTVLATDPRTGTNKISIDPEGNVDVVAAISQANLTGRPSKVEPVPATTNARLVSGTDSSTPATPNTDEKLRVTSASLSAVTEAPTRRETRQLTARDFAESRPQAAPAPALEGWRGQLNRATGGKLRVAPSKVELLRRSRQASVQRGLPGHKTAAIINLKGGIGKTTTTMLIASVIGRVRGGTILAWDANEYKGTMGIRAQAASHDHTAHDLLKVIDSFTNQSSSADLVNFVRPQGESKFDVLASQSLAGNSAVIDGEDFRKMHAALRRFYRLILVDTGNNPGSGTWQTAVETADVLILPTIVKEDSARTLAAVADTLIEQGHGDKLNNAVTIMGRSSLTSYPELEQRIIDHMGQLTRAVVSVPFDAALDRGDTIDFDKLTPESQEAWLEATAAVMDGLN